MITAITLFEEEDLPEKLISIILVWGLKQM